MQLTLQMHPPVEILKLESHAVLAICNELRGSLIKEGRGGGEVCNFVYIPLEQLRERILFFVLREGFFFLFLLTNSHRGRCKGEVLQLNVRGAAVTAKV